jgi:DNA-directed RNA polymerase subunit beta
MVHEVKMGKRTRMSFSRINEVLDMPDLIEVQRNSFERFLAEDLREVLNDISPITDYSEKLVLEFVDYYIDRSNPKYSVEECKERDVNYSAPLKVVVRLINKETGEVKQQEVFMGDFPLMTEQGTFIINGAERVIVSLLVRPPGVYFSKPSTRSVRLYFPRSDPNPGPGLSTRRTATKCVGQIDRQRKVHITALLRRARYGTKAQIEELLADERLTLPAKGRHRLR